MTALLVYAIFFQLVSSVISELVWPYQTNFSDSFHFQPTTLKWEASTFQYEGTTNFDGRNAFYGIIFHVKSRADLLIETFTIHTTTERINSVNVRVKSGFFNIDEETDKSISEWTLISEASTLVGTYLENESYQISIPNEKFDKLIMVGGSFNTFFISVDSPVLLCSEGGNSGYSDESTNGMIEIYEGFGTTIPNSLSGSQQPFVWNGIIAYKVVYPIYDSYSEHSLPTPPTTSPKGESSNVNPDGRSVSNVVLSFAYFKKDGDALPDMEDLSASIEDVVSLLFLSSTPIFAEQMMIESVISQLMSEDENCEKYCLIEVTLSVSHGTKTSTNDLRKLIFHVAEDVPNHLSSMKYLGPTLFDQAIVFILRGIGLTRLELMQMLLFEQSMKNFLEFELGKTDSGLEVLSVTVNDQNILKDFHRSRQHTESEISGMAPGNSSESVSYEYASILTLYTDVKCESKLYAHASLEGKISKLVKEKGSFFLEQFKINGHVESIMVQNSTNKEWMNHMRNQMNELLKKDQQRMLFYVICGMTAFIASFVTWKISYYCNRKKYWRSSSNVLDTKSGTDLTDTNTSHFQYPNREESFIVIPRQTSKHDWGLKYMQSKSQRRKSSDLEAHKTKKSRFSFRKLNELKEKAYSWSSNREMKQSSRYNQGEVDHFDHPGLSQTSTRIGHDDDSDPPPPSSLGWQAESAKKNIYDYLAQSVSQTTFAFGDDASVVSGALMETVPEIDSDDNSSYMCSDPVERNYQHMESYYDGNTELDHLNDMRNHNHGRSRSRHYSWTVHNDHNEEEPRYQSSRRYSTSFASEMERGDSFSSQHPGAHPHWKQSRRPSTAGQQMRRQSLGGPQARRQSIGGQQQRRQSFGGPQPRRPSISWQEPPRSGQQPRRPSISGQQPRRPSISGQQPRRPSISGQQPRRPSISGQQPRRPSISGQQPRRPSISGQQPRRPSINGQLPLKPSIRGGTSYGARMEVDQYGNQKIPNEQLPFGNFVNGQRSLTSVMSKREKKFPIIYDDEGSSKELSCIPLPQIKSEENNEIVEATQVSNSEELKVSNSQSSKTIQAEEKSEDNIADAHFSDPSLGSSKSSKSSTSLKSTRHVVKWDADS